MTDQPKMCKYCDSSNPYHHYIGCTRPNLDQPKHEVVATRTEEPKRPQRELILQMSVADTSAALCALEAQIASLREEVAQLKLLLELYETLEDIDGDEPDLSSSERPTNPIDGESR